MQTSIKPRRCTNWQHFSHMRNVCQNHFEKKNNVKTHKQQTPWRKLPPKSGWMWNIYSKILYVETKITQGNKKTLILVTLLVGAKFLKEKQKWHMLKWGKEDRRLRLLKKKQQNRRFTVQQVAVLWANTQINSRCHMA